MRKVKYILMIIASVMLFNSCLDDTTDLELNASGPNVVTFDRIITNLTAVANGNEYNFKVKIRLVGPSVTDVKGNITITAVANAKSTAVVNTMYRINNLPLVLTPKDNFLGELDITMVTDGNSPPMDGTPEFDAYKAPVLYLDLSATGDAKVKGSGKTGQLNLNFTAPNPWAGDYVSTLKYFHPTAGGSYPDEPYGGIRESDKTLVAVTGRKSETGFGVWATTDLCWITVKADNSIVLEINDAWPYDVKLGDPNDPSKVSHFDPVSRIIYLYYYYAGTGGNRIFWEEFSPKF